ncbi:MAG: glutamyl-tRNA reductase [Simkaniaceae bacterium]|nr:MAG: glutamyl-tRNA reductase [Simkaniaceae bacterium]
MQVGIVGINHKSSTLPLREALARAFQRAFEKRDGVLLSTCNRTEFYFCARSLAETQMEILFLLREEMDENFEHALYSYFGHDCFNHLGRVVSGVDSAIFGESDIQRQVKLAYEYARKKGELSHEIHYLFQKGLKIGKEMRSSFLMSKKETPLPVVIQGILEKNQRLVEDSQILFVGNSAINRKLISYFQFRGAKKLTLCTRMKKGEFPKILIEDWGVLKKWDSYDVVICGTYHKNHILTRSTRSLHQTLLFDLSVPRNIDPKLGAHPKLKLYNIDQIGKLAQKKSGEKEITLCENVIEKAVQRQMQLFKERKQAKWRYAVSQ